METSENGQSRSRQTLLAQWRGTEPSFNPSQEERTPIAERVREINERAPLGNLDRYLVLGRFIVDSWFNGDVSIYRRECRRDPEWKRVRHHQQLKVSRDQLNTAIAVFEQFQRLDRAVATKLSVAHHRALSAIEDQTRSRFIGKTAATEGWSVRRIREEIAEERESTATAELAEVMAHLKRVADRLQTGEVSMGSRDDLAKAHQMIDTGITTLRRLNAVLSSNRR